MRRYAARVWLPATLFFVTALAGIGACMGWGWGLWVGLYSLPLSLLSWWPLTAKLERMPVPLGILAGGLAGAVIGGAAPFAPFAGPSLLFSLQHLGRPAESSPTNLVMIIPAIQSAVGLPLGALVGACSAGLQLWSIRRAAPATALASDPGDD